MSSKPKAKFAKKTRSTYRKDIRDVLKRVSRDDAEKALIGKLTLTVLNDFVTTLITKLGITAAEFADSKGGHTIGSEEAAAAVISTIRGELGRAAGNSGFTAVQKFTTKKNKPMKPGRLCKFVESK